MFYDVSHFKDRIYDPRLPVPLHYPSVMRALKQGAEQIDDMGFPNDIYMIISPSLKIKIPVIIQNNTREPHEKIGMLPTVMPVEYRTDADNNYRKAIEIFVESFKHIVEIQEFPGLPEFVSFLENGRVVSSYTSIYV